MAALTQDRDTPTKSPLGVLTNYKVKAATKIFAGALVGVDVNGWALPAADAASMKVVGRAEQQVDNSAGANGDLSIDVRRGIFKYNTTGGNALVQADVAQKAFVLDDNNVVKTAGTVNAIVAGRVAEIDPDGGIWVEIIIGTP